VPKQLTTQNATITTASVEVKTLTISGKQVTLAVFRQLREEELIDWDGALNGSPWGYVNYHPDKCEGSRWAHRHIVWQRGPELLRSRVDTLPDFAAGSRHQANQNESGPMEFVCDEVDLVLSWYVLMWLDGKLDKCPLRRDPRRDVAGYIAGASLDSKHGFALPAIASDAAVKAANLEEESVNASAQWNEARDRKPNPFYASVEDYEREAREAEAAAYQAKEALRREIEPHGKAAWETTQRLIEAEIGRRKRHYDARAELGKLPQLFIAV